MALNAARVAAATARSPPPGALARSICSRQILIQLKLGAATGLTAGGSAGVVVRAALTRLIFAFAAATAPCVAAAAAAVLSGAGQRDRLVCDSLLLQLLLFQILPVPAEPPVSSHTNVNTLTDGIASHRIASHLAKVRRLMPSAAAAERKLSARQSNAALSNALIAIVHKDFVADANVCDDHHADEESALRAVTLKHELALVFTRRHFGLWLQRRAT